MKRMWTIMICFASVVQAQPETVLTLEQAISIGRENSRALQISVARAEAAAARAGEAGTAMLPSVRLAGNYTKLKPGQFVLSTPASPQPIQVAPVVDDSYAFLVGVRQPLFGGFRLRRQAEAADAQAEASSLETRMSRSNVVLGITTAYWTMYQAREVRASVAENVRRLEAYVADTERLMTAGLATRNDLLRMQVQLASSRISLIDIENEVQLATMSLNSMIGLPLETPLVPGSEPGDIVDRGDSLARMIDAGLDSVVVHAALETRPDLRASRLLEDAAKAGVAAAEAGYWPQIDLAANYNYNRPNSRYQPVTDAFFSSWDVGVTLQWDVWNWGRTSRQREQAEASMRQAEQQSGLLRDDIVLEVQRAALGSRRSREKLEVAQLAVRQAEENRRIADEKYRSGVATSADLLDADVALVQAETQLTAAKVELAVALARLERSVGGERQSIAER